MMKRTAAQAIRAIPTIMKIGTGAAGLGNDDLGIGNGQPDAVHTVAGNSAVVVDGDLEHFAVQVVAVGSSSLFDIVVAGLK